MVSSSTPARPSSRRPSSSRSFALFGREMSDYVDLRPVEPWYRFRFDDGREFDHGGTTDALLDEIGCFPRGDREGYLKMVDTLVASSTKDSPSSRTSSSAPATCFFEVVPALSSTSQRPIGLRDGPRRHLKDPAAWQAFSIQPLLVGGNPFDTTSIYFPIHYLEREVIHFPMGGTGALVAGLERLLRRRRRRAASRRRRRSDRLFERSARGVRLADGTTARPEIVVSNADAPLLYREMMSEGPRRCWTPRKIDRMRYSMYPVSARDDEAVSGRRTPYDRDGPTRIRSCSRTSSIGSPGGRLQSLSAPPTATDPSMAPPGCDAWYVLSPVPNLQADIDWDQEGDRYRDRIVDTDGGLPRSQGEHHRRLLHDAARLRRSLPQSFRGGLLDPADADAVGSVPIPQLIRGALRQSLPRRRGHSSGRWSAGGCSAPPRYWDRSSRTLGSREVMT